MIDNYKATMTEMNKLEKKLFDKMVLNGPKSWTYVIIYFS